MRRWLSFSWLLILVWVFAGACQRRVGGEKPKNGGASAMPLMIEERNALVKMQQDPDAPEVRGPGVEITLGGEERPRFPLGEPVTLRATIQADVKLLAQVPGDIASGAFLTIIRLDKPFGRTAQLIVPTVLIPKPPPSEEAGGDYLETTNFQVDLVKFFELPQEPGSYSIQAALGPYFSDRLEFDIVEE